MINAWAGSPTTKQATSAGQIPHQRPVAAKANAAQKPSPFGNHMKPNPTVPIAAPAKLAASTAITVVDFEPAFIDQ